MNTLKTQFENAIGNFYQAKKEEALSASLPVSKVAGFDEPSKEDALSLSQEEPTTQFVGFEPTQATKHPVDYFYPPGFEPRNLTGFESTYTGKENKQSTLFLTEKTPKNQEKYKLHCR